MPQSHAMCMCNFPLKHLQMFFFFSWMLRKTKKKKQCCKDFKEKKSACMHAPGAGDPGGYRSSKIPPKRVFLHPPKAQDQINKASPGLAGGPTLQVMDKKHHLSSGENISEDKQGAPVWIELV